MKTPQPDLVASLAAEILLIMPPTAVSLVGAAGHGFDVQA